MLGVKIRETAFRGNYKREGQSLYAAAYFLNKTMKQFIYLQKQGQGNANIMKYVYLTSSIIIIALLCTICCHIMTRREEQKQMQTESILPFGDYLPTAENPLIRVVIKTNGFRNIAHTNVSISSGAGCIVICGEETQEIASGETVSFTPDDVRFQNGTIRIKSKTENEKLVLSSISRGYGIPSYRGEIELFATAEGIVIVNELPVEEYLYAVVPSEMPASYEKEALKCQAVCARSYAYCQMLAFAYPEYLAHVDDSVSFQVYGNSLEKETTTQAVQETIGQKVWFQNEVVKTYYYSTSCGHSTSIEAWGTALSEKNSYLCGRELCDVNKNAYEKNLPWYRWKAVIPQKTMGNLIELNTGKEIGTLQDVLITKRGVGNIVQQIEAVGTEGKIVVETENKIRKALGGEGFQIEKQDGNKVNSSALLPSAFFTIAKNGENYIIEGGGYGHGIGMSQNGANEMAKTGMSHTDILTFFYPGTKVY